MERLVDRGVEVLALVARVCVLRDQLGVGDDQVDAAAELVAMPVPLMWRLERDATDRDLRTEREELGRVLAYATFERIAGGETAGR